MVLAQSAHVLVVLTCLVCPLQNSSDVATAKLQRTSGYLTHPPGHCGLELLPLSPDTSRQRLLQEDLNMPLAAESLVGEDRTVTATFWHNYVEGAATTV